MRTQIRIVAGRLRGRKLTCNVGPNMRPTPQMVREALFSILGNAVPGRPFFDVFAGTGVNGLEALSRGASGATFVERDFRLLAEIQQHLVDFGVNENARAVRGDVYRWVDHWAPPAEPVNVFLSPPYPDLDRRPEALLHAIRCIQEKVHPGTVVILQSEVSPLLDELPEREAWEERRYGRNHLLFWVKPEAPSPEQGDPQLP